MLREALRRLLWLGPTLLVVTVPTFWALARATDQARPPGEARPPLFLNADPVGAREHALRAVSAIAAGGPDAAYAERRLGDLGGAALPHVLPRLDGLSPDARGRVALSLAPIASRMGIGAKAEFDTPEAAIRFFTRYSEEHAIDFRAPLVRRTVRRFADHPSKLRRTEVIELDTFALEELIDAMRPLGTAADVERVRHVCEAAAHVSGNTWAVPDGASIDEARQVVLRWDDWWVEHRREYTPLTGTRRLGATVLDTRYGRWIEHFLRHELRGREGGLPEASALSTRGQTTLWLLLSAVVLGYPLALVLGAAASLRRHSLSDAGISALVVAAAAAGAVGLAAGVAMVLGTAGPVAGPALAMALVGVASASLHQRAIQSRVAELVYLRTQRAFGASRVRILIRSARATAGAAIALAVSDLPGLLTAAFVVEHAFSLHGLGATAIDAVRTGDHSGLMGLALLGTLTLGVLQIAADLAQRALDPRTQSAPRRARGAGL